MSKLQELLDIIKAKGGEIEKTRKRVFNAAVSLDASVELIAEAMLEVIKDDERENAAKLEKEGKNE